MKRLSLAGMGLLICLAPARAGDDPGIKATIAYVQKLQTSTGGFLQRVPRPEERLIPTLRATSAGVRTLHYLGGKLPNKGAAVKFVESCHDADSGGFADRPMGKPDVVTTAIGMMAVHELDMPVDKYAPGVLKFLSENARTFEEIRIAVAGMENLKDRSPRTAAWIEEVQKIANDDGTFGKGPGQARATGGAVVALLRMGVKVKNPEVIVKTLRTGQRLSGGFGKEDSEVTSDLETSYRVMRCFHMLKEQPKDVEGMRSFIAKCRNDDGGYAVAPGEPSSIAGTYYAAIIRRWLERQK